MKIAVRECMDFAAGHPLPEKIIFACFDSATLAAYEAELTLEESLVTIASLSLITD